MSYRQFADMFRTNTAVVEKTCWYLNDEMRKIVAIASHLQREYGTINVT